MQLPAIDQNICGAWTQQQKDLYNKLDFYLMQAQADYRKHWVTWPKLLSPIPWKPNQAETLRRVGTEPTPIMRQEAVPATLQNDPNTDVISVRERKVDSKPRWQDFVSPHFHWLPSFQDFMKHIDDTMENINKQTSYFEDIFYRTMLFHWAPYVYVCGVGMVQAPTADPSTDGSTGKTNAWLQAQITALSGVGENGNLTFSELYKAFNQFEQEAGATPFMGSGLPGGDSSPLNEKFCLVQSPESWNNFVDDPWVKENRPLGMNIVTESFKGDIFGRIRSKAERYPLRYAVTNDWVPSQKQPEVIEENPNASDFGRTKPNFEYARPSESPIEVAFLVGGKPAEYIEVGPPPAEFTRNLDQGSAVKMNWNGKAYLTKEFLVPCKNAAGDTVLQANSFGRYLRAQATLALGISIFNGQNIMPIIYKRRVALTTVS